MSMVYLVIGLAVLLLQGIKETESYLHNKQQDICSI